MHFHALVSQSGSSLPGDIASWPVPNESDCWVLSLTQYFSTEASRQRGFGLSWLSNRRTSKKALKNCKAALEAALTRRDIDEIELSAICVPKKQVTDLVKRLLAQEERERTVRYILGAGDLSRDFEWLGHLNSRRYLSLLPNYSAAISPGNQLFSVTPILRSFPNLEQLNLAAFALRPVDIAELYQDEYLAERTPHVSLRLDLDNEPNSEACFPSAANEHLFSLLFPLSYWPSPVVLRGWIQAASNLENLMSLTFPVSIEPAMEAYQQCFETLYDWIGNPSCSLREIALMFPEGFAFSKSDDDPSFSLFQNVIPAIAQNRSLQRLMILTKHQPIDCILPLLSAVSTESSNIDYFAPWYNWEDAQRLNLNFLLRWQIEMRSTSRFMALFLISVNEDHHQIEYVTRIHLRWQNWQNHLQSDAQTSHVGVSLANVDSCFWAVELERIDKTNSADLRAVSLDAIYFLLQVWLCNVSAIPQPIWNQ